MGIVFLLLTTLTGAADGLPDWLIQPGPAHVALSTDGEQVAWAEHDRVRVAPVDQAEQGTARQLPGRITGIWWQGAELLVRAAGEEEVLIWLDPTLAESRILRRLPWQGHGRIDVVHLWTDSVLLSVDETGDFEPELEQVWSLTGARRPVARNPGRVFHWLADVHGRVEAALRWQPSTSGVRYEWLSRVGSMWQSTRGFELGEAEEQVLRVGPEGLLFASSGRGGSSLRWYDPIGRRLQGAVWRGEPGTIRGVVDATGGGAPAMVMMETDRLAALTEHGGWSERLAGLQQRWPGSSFALVGRADQDQRLLWRVTSDRQPPRYVLQYEHELTELFESSVRPEQERAQQPFSFSARDGLALDGYVTRPEGGGAGPAVVLVHGGPWARDSWTFDAEAQFLARAGYTVLQVNYRGSRGLGPDRLVAGRREWGQGMQTDLEDAVSHAAQQGWIDPQLVCVMGGSYGGYAALMGVLETPQTYRCAVARAPVTDVAAQVDSIRRSGNRRGYLEWTEMVGPPDQLAAISPIGRADALQRPVLLAHGDRDRVIDIAQSRRFAQAAGDNVQWLPLAGVGHVLDEPEARRRYYSAVRDFLAVHLGN